MRKWVAIAFVIGCCLGAWQVVSDSSDDWQAVHASLPTIVLQAGAGALTGGLFLGAVVFYLGRRGWLAWWISPSQRRSAPASSSIRMDRERTPIRYTARHLLVLIFGVVLLGAGALVVLACLRHPTIYGLLRGAAAGLFFMALGGFLVWDDFVAPHVSDRKSAR